jgi:AcrR family transcriptional regulator
VLAAAATLFNEKGLKGTTLAEVALRVGLITTSLTHYYRKKEVLAAACYTRSLETLNRLVSEAERAPSAQERLSQFLQCYFALMAAIADGSYPDQVNFFDLRALKGPEADAVRRRFIDLFRRLKRLVFLRAPLSRNEKNARTHLLYSSILFARSWAHHDVPPDHEKAGDRLLDILLGGLAGPRANPMPPTIEIAAPPISPDEAAHDAFLRAATDLINDLGYHGASVEQISAKLGVTKGSFYHHNTSKDGLVADCFARSFALVERAQRAATAQGGGGWDKLAGATAALMRHQYSPQGPLLRYTAFNAAPAAMRAELMHIRQGLTETFAGFITEGIADGSIRRVDVPTAARHVEAMINAACELKWWLPEISAENVWDLYARPLFYGILAGASEPD